MSYIQTLKTGPGHLVPVLWVLLRHLLRAGREIRSLSTQTGVLRPPTPLQVSQLLLPSALLASAALLGSPEQRERRPRQPLRPALRLRPAFSSGSPSHDQRDAPWSLPQPRKEATDVSSPPEQARAAQRGGGGGTIEKRPAREGLMGESCRICKALVFS